MLLRPLRFIPAKHRIPRLIFPICPQHFPVKPLFDRWTRSCVFSRFLFIPFFLFLETNYFNNNEVSFDRVELIVEQKVISLLTPSIESSDNQNRNDAAGSRFISFPSLFFSTSFHFTTSPRPQRIRWMLFVLCFFFYLFRSGQRRFSNQRPWQSMIISISINRSN